MSESKTVLLFPGLDAIFDTRHLKKWLQCEFIHQKLQEASTVLEGFSGQKENLSQLVQDSRRIHLVDFDRTLIVLTTLQVAIAENLKALTQWDLVQGCSHGDLARNVVSGVTRFTDAIEILWTFSQMRLNCPKGYTANVRDHEMKPLSNEQLQWLEDYQAPVSRWSFQHATIAGEESWLYDLKERAPVVGLKIKPVLPYPVHSPAMKPMMKEIAQLAKKWPLSLPHTPVFSSLWLKYLETEEDFLLEGLANSLLPIRWLETLEKVYKEEGATRFINVGPSNTLTGWLLESPEYAGLEVLEAWDLISP